jgi:hypothetical protein
MAGAVLRGLEPAVRGASAALAPGDVLSAKAPAVAVATEALACIFVAALGVVREVIAPDHVHRVGPGSLLEPGVCAQTREPTAGTFPVVQAQHGLLDGFQSDFAASTAPYGCVSGGHFGLYRGHREGCESSQEDCRKLDCYLFHEMLAPSN